MSERFPVSISNGRKWLAVLTAGADGEYWSIYERVEIFNESGRVVDGYESWGDMPGEGMSAEEVMEALLELVEDAKSELPSLREEMKQVQAEIDKTLSPKEQLIAWLWAEQLKAALLHGTSVSKWQV